MTSVLIVALTESMHRKLPVVQFGVAVVDGVAMTVRNKLTKSASQKQRRGSFLMMNMMKSIFGMKTTLDAHGVRLKFQLMNHMTPARKSINAMNASVTSS